jgi:hypothetical protein
MLSGAWCFTTRCCTLADTPAPDFQRQRAQMNGRQHDEDINHALTDAANANGT